uniref:N-acetyltransferase ESCO acetyl-transferase domain-containing protein n=1 Tax=Rhodosorus marinus TaxID=101924 RepID=A0A7S0BK40_9RHOD|mmetsp:Transcript_19089/g.27662  ORF Transcript_19089/g.27662 Transcript_19089/m.27662 type:complete len:188 (+) Transcript_19089:482-1045(+)
MEKSEQNKNITWGSRKNELVLSVSTGSRIVAIGPDDSNAVHRRLRLVEDLVVDELGSFRGYSDRRWAYLYIQNKSVVGCLFAERLAKAYAATDGENLDEGGVQRALLGVQMIWVRKTFRRDNIATKLIDAARGHLIYGAVIPKRMVAFTPLTSSGAAFARKYVQESGNLLLYRPYSATSTRAASRKT